MTSVRAELQQWIRAEMPNNEELLQTLENLCFSYSSSHDEARRGQIREGIRHIQNLLGVADTDLNLNSESTPSAPAGLLDSSPLGDPVDLCEDQRPPDRAKAFQELLNQWRDGKPIPF